MSNYGLSYQRPMYPPNEPLTSYPFYAQLINLFPNAPMYPNYGPTSLSADSTGCVTPFVRWIEDYPLLDGLKIPSHVASYDGKEDPDNYLHLFEGAIRMQKWAMPVACHIFTYTLKDSTRIWWNDQKSGSIINYKDLKAKFRSHFSQQKNFTKTHLAVHNIKQRDRESTRDFVTRQGALWILSMNLPTTYKGLMENTYTWIEAKEVATNGASNDHREGFDILNKGEWKKGDKDIIPAKSPILMVSRESHVSKRRSVEEPVNGIGEITFPPVSGSDNSSDPVIIKAQISKIQVNQVTKDVLSCVDAKERIIVNDKFLEQTLVIGKQLRTSYKRKLQDLLRSNVDVFTGTYADMIGILRTIMVGGKPFNTKHTLNEYKHIEPVKKKKRGLAPE
ncbi:reverse transcriptase domain-containing protein [Tanacetum coccineum]|uniref:Reverse transcriptase domain-containing protein n=1 Tax=Tanacetum coccineum TaxID=301880 RepID=A0ABQ5CRV2_9ASTR